MKITKLQLQQIIKEEIHEARATNPDSEIFADTISHHSMVLTSKMNSLISKIYEELGKLNLDRDAEREMLYAAARELNELKAQNPMANVVLEQLKFLGSPAVLLKEIGDSIEVFGE